MNLQEVHQWLLDNRYLLATKDKGYVIAKRYNDDVKVMKRKIETGEPDKSILPFKVDRDLTLSGTPQHWTELFMQFIKEAQVPHKVMGSRGEPYVVNKYSEPAMKQFRKMIEKEGIDYPLLVKSTMLYYKSSNKFKKIIANYIIDGDWRTDYLALKDAAETGVENLNQHIEDELKSDGPGSYRSSFG